MKKYSKKSKPKESQFVLILLFLLGLGLVWIGLKSNPAIFQNLSQIRKEISETFSSESPDTLVQSSGDFEFDFSSLDEDLSGLGRLGKKDTDPFENSMNVKKYKGHGKRKISKSDFKPNTKKTERSISSVDDPQTPNQSAWGWRWRKTPKDSPASIVFLKPAPGTVIDASNQFSFPVSGSCSPPDGPITITGDAEARTNCSNTGSFTSDLDFSHAPDGGVWAVASISDKRGDTATAYQWFNKWTLSPVPTSTLPTSSPTPIPTPIGGFSNMKLYDIQVEVPLSPTSSDKSTMFQTIAFGHEPAYFDFRTNANRTLFNVAFNFRNIGASSATYQLKFMITDVQTGKTNYSMYQSTTPLPARGGASFSGGDSYGVTPPTEKNPNYNVISVEFRVQACVESINPPEDPATLSDNCTKPVGVWVDPAQ